MKSTLKGIFTDRVRSTRWEVIVSLCQSTPAGVGGGYPTSGNRLSTRYAVVGMPLAFTQEDFLVTHMTIIPQLRLGLIFDSCSMAALVSVTLT